MTRTREQKPIQWRRTKFTSSLVTGFFELYAEGLKGGWSVCVATRRTADCGRMPLVWLDVPRGATREDAERAACHAARTLARELRKAARMAPKKEEPKPKPAPPRPPPEPQAALTIAAVLDAERTLSANNVPPPYELRTMRSAIEGMFAQFGEMREAGPAVVPPDLILEPGETFMGSVAHTRLIAVDNPTTSGFVCGKRTLPAF